MTLSSLNCWQPRSLYQEATTLPAEMYTSDEIYQLEKELIFGKTWCYVGHKNQLQGNGSYFTVELAEQPLVIVQTQTGDLRGYFNICPHRAGPVAVGSGTSHHLTCLYHAWSFDLSGKLRGLPDMELAENFDRDRHGLQPIQVDTWGPFIFVNLDRNAAPLSVQLGELPALFQHYRFSEWARVHSVDYSTETNWKLYVENNVESYHEFSVHASIAKYYKATRAEARHYYYLQYAPFPPDDDAYTMPADRCFAGLGEVERNGKWTVSFFPNFAWIIRPWIAIIYLIDPQGRSRTRIRWDWLVPDTESAKAPENLEPLIQFFDTIQQEDLRLLPEIQKRIHSLGYRPGRLSPTREMGTHLFQELTMQHLASGFQPKLD
ncbi:aromatic ring-hydroxylating dioxygenase subunit alpha [Oculatella sp. LEGE 06141]|uniref:aromatic ring-hydroxylating oxygenase subunit alpha n=1 Tax=Oculatella sp. LEGE 06141 TaxID=1828648 RepID=UPI001880573D|nr:aromatic ring-hydroxylating dioxygenase subunit alpha [Oculatella sp. LEGE 06141]MBE9181795.1 aromatic ring-hydroxylating dioxygenase subunit alpha [Oculatella sp. LEGE 06141]